MPTNPEIEARDKLRLKSEPKIQTATVADGAADTFAVDTGELEVAELVVEPERVPKRVHEQALVTRPSSVPPPPPSAAFRKTASSWPAPAGDAASKHTNSAFVPKRPLSNAEQYLPPSAAALSASGNPGIARGQGPTRASAAPPSAARPVTAASDSGMQRVELTAARADLGTALAELETVRTELTAARAENTRLARQMRARDAYLAELEHALDEASRQLVAGGLGTLSDAARLIGRVRGQAFRIAELEAELRQTVVSLARLRGATQPRRTQQRDDLQLIRGVGPRLAEQLYELGVAKFETIAQWTAPDLLRVADHLCIRAERIERDAWIEQARALQGRTQSS
jgi:predicted flap endonuclease-1-like 5' DNA nuclease